MTQVEIPSQFYDEEGELVEDERFFAWLRLHAVPRPVEVVVDVRELVAVLALVNESLAHLSGAVERLSNLTVTE